MKQCNQCQVTMFDGCLVCGICGSNSLKQLTPIRKPKQKTKKIPVRNTNKNDIHYANGINQIGSGIYEVESKTNSRKKYTVDINNLRDHKGDCFGYRYKQDCNHLQRLREAGVKV